MIEITYADMFLCVVIFFLGGALVKSKLEIAVHRKLTMLGLEAILEGEAEVYRDNEGISIRGIKK